MTAITFEQITEVYKTLAEALRVAQDAAEKAVMIKLRLEAVRMASIRSGVITGKNEAEREANMNHLFIAYYTDVEVHEREAREARHRVELARLEVDALRMQLRVAELAAREEV